MGGAAEHLEFGNAETAVHVCPRGFGIMEKMETLGPFKGIYRFIGVILWVTSFLAETFGYCRDLNDTVIQGI